MKILIKEIPRDGLNLTQDVEPVTIGLNADECPCVSPLHVKGHVQKAENTVLAHIEVKAQFLYTCSRCLEPFEKSSTKEFDFDYAVDKSISSVDIGEDIRQEMIVDVPVKVLCREDCKGICIKCGANLNYESCRCQ